MNKQVTRGGEPIGFIGLSHLEDGRRRLVTNVVDELREEEWAEKLLLTLAGQLRQAIAEAKRA